ncbi:MAG: hypothetical protein KIS65_03070 [Nitrosomonas sp.]|nr:hypothetical protein [Nitrosomonas sp.]
MNHVLNRKAYLSTLRPTGRLHFVGAVLNTLRTMLEFAVRHDIQPIVEFFPFEQVNEALSRLESGKTRYRIVHRHAV